jgi:tellurite resistance protein TehA-like permease
MATGIVSIAADPLFAAWLARALLWLNVVLYLALTGLAGWRCAAFPGRVAADFRSHAHAPGFLTAVAATCVLGATFVAVADHWSLALGLWFLGLALWTALLYTLFLVLTVRETKPRLEQGMNGTWMLVVVSTQSLSVLGALLAPGLGQFREPAFVFATGTFLLGGLFYVLLLSLVLYRFLFFPVDPEQFAPPYWIAMGAVAITTLSGALLVRAAGGSAFLADIRPFVKGMTVMFWAMATWWIPLLLLLGAWRHLARRVPLRYDTQYWSMVFPIGMYTVATVRLEEALDWPVLRALAYAAGFGALGTWTATFIGLLRRVRG